MPGITDLRAYSTLDTDNAPVFLARDSSNQIITDSGVKVGQLTGASLGACMIPYRPNASPQSWMYIGAQEDYRKYSAPDILTGAVTEFEVGIQEQQQPPDACPNAFFYADYFGLAASFANGGTAAAASNTVLLTDTAGIVIPDPACGTTIDRRASVEVTITKKYQIGMALTLNGVPCVVQDILPAVNQGTAITIQSIYYFSGGSTGHCVIVPTQGPVATPFQNEGTPAPSIYAMNPLSALRRGSIVKLTGGVGTEKLFVLNSVTGPDGTICFEVTTTKAFVSGDSVTGLPAISLSNVGAGDSGTALASPDITFTVAAGTGTQDTLYASSPFNVIGASGKTTTQQYDYLGFSLNISDLNSLVSVRIIFNVDSTVNFTQNAFYVQFDVTDFAGVDNDGSVLPANQEVALWVPINKLNRIGEDLTRTLSDMNGMRIEVVTTASITVRAGPFWVGEGNQPDVGSDGSPYFYAVRSRNTLTGAASNPSPVSRYGVGPRRQSVRVIMHDSSAGSQGDMWDVFRMGGKVPTMRYIGSTLNTGGVDTFIDNYFDTAALGGSEIEYDNLQPWPTIDQPFNIQWGGGGGITIRLTVIGTVLEIVWYSASSFANPAPATITRWLPGTLVSIDGLNAYTLFNRPEPVTLASPPGAFYFAYVLRFVENAGSFSPTTVSILEPNIANQPLPYLWGPDAEGTVFGCGDPFRPGTVYFCKSFVPDSAPSDYNLEITPPSEPLMGGETINGLSYLSSTERWWALYPSFESTQRYQKVQQPVERGMVAPYAHCTNGKTIFFVAKDGVWNTAGQSLTDADLYNIFPHEGVVGADYIYAGQTVYAPDYRYAGSFRLAFKSGYIYFDYRDSENRPRTLVCDYRNPERPAWCVDVYADPIAVHYAVEQQAGTLLTETQTYIKLVMGDDNGIVHAQVVDVNDNGTPINAKVSVAEWDGGDSRATQLFNDEFLDLVPYAPAGVSVTPITQGSAVAAPTIIPTGTVRLQTNVPVGQELSSMGVLIQWTDDFTVQDFPTILRAFQPMYQPVPVSVFLWKTQGTTFGIKGYKHIRQVLFAYRSTAAVTLTITVYDGTPPAVVTLPSTGGNLAKIQFPFTFNKGLIYFFESTSTQPWTPYFDQTEFYVGEWGREGQYVLIHDVAPPIGIAP